MPNLSKALQLIAALLVVCASMAAQTAQLGQSQNGATMTIGQLQNGASTTISSTSFTYTSTTSSILVNPPAAYALGGTTKNGATVTDGSYAAAGLSGTPATVARCTDVNMTPGRPTTPGFNAGEGGSGASTLVSADDSALRLEGSSGYYIITLFNPTTMVCGDPTTGNVITQDKNLASPGSSSAVEAFGNGTFDQSLGGLYTVGGVTTRVTSSTQVTQYTINTNSGPTSTWGNFTYAAIADFADVLPLNPSAWAATTTYAFGATVSYALSGSQLVTYPTSPSTITPNVGDLIQPVAGCAFKATKVTGPTGGTTPNWTSICSSTMLGSLTDGGVTWKGIGGAAVFVYQNVGTTGQSGGSAPTFCAATPCHPTLMTTASDANGVSWTNIGTVAGVTWQSWGGSGLASKVPNEGFSTETYGLHQTQGITNITISSGTATIHWSTNNSLFIVAGPATISGTSVSACNTAVTLLTSNASTATFSAGSCTAATGGTAVGDLFNQNGDQGSGIFAVEYDANINTYHLFNTATLIQTDAICTGGTGPDQCGGVTPAFTSYGPMTGTTCTAFIHNVKSRYGNHVIVAKQGTIGTGACAVGSWSWRAQQTPLVASTQVSELEFQPNHWDDQYQNFFAVTLAGYPSNTSGYGEFAVQEPLSVLPFAYPPPAVWVNYPCSTGSAPFTTTPPCQIQGNIDSHLSCAYNPNQVDTYPCMGTVYNVATLDINPYMAWQGEEVAVSTSPATIYSLFPLSASPGNKVWRFAHTSNWGTSQSFSAQFAISEVSPAGDFIFWTSDNQGTFGSTTGSAPIVCSGSCPQSGQFVVNPVPASPSCMGGPVWEPNHNYVVGNVIVPLNSGNTASGGTADIFQVVSITGTGTSSSSQPSAFASTSYPNQVTDNQVTWQDLYTAPGANGGSLCRNDVLVAKLPHL